MLTLLILSKHSENSLTHIIKYEDISVNSKLYVSTCTSFCCLMGTTIILTRLSKEIGFIIYHFL